MVFNVSWMASSYAAFKDPVIHFVHGDLPNAEEASETRLEMQL